MKKKDEQKFEHSKVISSRIITIINLKQTLSAKNLLQIVIGMHIFIFFHKLIHDLSEINLLKLLLVLFLLLLFHQFLTLFFLLNQGGRRRAAQSSTTPATPGTPGNATILVESTPNVVHTETVETTPSENVNAGPTE